MCWRSGSAERSTVAAEAQGRREPREASHASLVDAYPWRRPVACTFASGGTTNVLTSVNVAPPPPPGRSGIRDSTVLVFKGVEDRSLTELGVLLRDIDALYWLCVEAVYDLRTLKKRIVAMREDGFTLQAIADRLNEDRVPTLRGGPKWRPTSVHAEIEPLDLIESVEVSSGREPAPPARVYLRPRIERSQLGSRLEISLELVEAVWRTAVGFMFTGVLAVIFKLPGERLQFRQFWRTRLASDKARREWIERTEAQYHESPIRLDDLILPEEAGKYLPEEDS